MSEKQQDDEDDGGRTDVVLVVDVMSPLIGFVLVVKAIQLCPRGEKAAYFIRTYGLSLSLSLSPAGLDSIPGLKSDPTAALMRLITQ